MNAPIAAITGLLALAAILWWSRGGEGEPTSSPEVMTRESEALVPDSPSIDGGDIAEAARPKESRATEASAPGRSDESEPVTAGESEHVGTRPSPFETSDERFPSLAPSSAPLGVDTGEAVPDSYPASEAARYFVPKEERRPGKLGGPPPLDFPGGPTGTGDGTPPLPAGSRQ